MTNISKNIVADEVLEEYSYEGQREKFPFKVFQNIENLIVQSTMVAYNNYNRDVKGFKEKTEIEVFNHFKNIHLKCAKQRIGKK